MTRRTSSDIFSEFERIRERVEQARRRVLGGPGSPRFCEPFMEPPVDVYQTEHEVVILVEMAGIAEEEVELVVEGNQITIRGERKPIPGRPGRLYSQMEICSGPFQRELTLPTEVDAEKAAAVYKDGILEIVLPKTSPTVHRQFRIVVH